MPSATSPSAEMYSASRTTATKKAQQEEKKKKQEESRRRRQEHEDALEAERTAFVGTPGLRAVPCEGCLLSALAGLSCGVCWDRVNEDGSPLAGRYLQYYEGSSCKPIPIGAIPIALFYLDYIQESKRLALAANNPGRAKRRLEENKRRITAKVVLYGCYTGTFPSEGDARLH